VALGVNRVSMHQTIVKRRPIGVPLPREQDLKFVETQSDIQASHNYLDAPGKPVAFYSDRHADPAAH
jgi:hypothetical protein